MRSPNDSVVRAAALTHSYGERRVLTDISLVVPAGQRIGLLGENGAGKSTLLRLLSGAEAPDEGEVTIPGAVGFLPQEVQAPPDATLGEIVESAIRGVRELGLELERTAAALGTADSRADELYARALEAADAADLWTIEARRDELLAGLGVGELPLDRPVAEVSGGQRSRVALAALLLSRPDVLLLDEPTNHLDDTAVSFLVQKLRAWRGPIVFASHDRAFLDDVATGLLDIDPAVGGVTRYGGGYTEYLDAKAAERARWEQRHADETAELGRLHDAIEHVAPAINHARPMRDRNKMSYGLMGNRVQQQISRRVRNAQGRLDDLIAHRVEAPPPVLTFAGIPRGAHALDTDEPLIRVDGARVGRRLAIESLTVEPRTRMLVTGANGAGKSTLLSLLAGSLRPDAGSVTWRPGLRVGMLGQDVRWEDAGRSARAMYARQVGVSRAESRPLVELGLLPERDLDRPVGLLSIGQQRRVALALTIAKPPHVFLLDEPTNHLSLTLATELEEALGDYPGAVLIASHDRWLRRRWTGDHLDLRDGRVAARISV